MRFLILALILLTLSACGKATYKLSDGEVVSCLEYIPQDCGVTLSRCDGGGVYTCQTNFTAL